MIRLIKFIKLLTTVFIVTFWFSLLGLSSSATESKILQNDEIVAEKPVTTGNSDVDRLLRKWYIEGSAAGNVGDWYDNRDRGHSLLDLSKFPQLKKITYTQQQSKNRKDWAAQRIILPKVTFGNSSTSGPPERGGSIPRHYYTITQGLRFIFTQYLKNNLYIYPEHRDHDPGHNGIKGYGDLYPSNTPFLIISQGSSGSDMPFLKAIAYTLAAFRPEVKTKLIKTGLLMPTLQMIMRMTNKNITQLKEYLSGKAHPTVFSGKNLNTMAMVKMAHDIKEDTIPPIALIKIKKKDEAISGRDFFDTNVGERLFDTPLVIARIFRGVDYKRTLTVQISSKGDVNSRPLTFHWAVLRGDSDRIEINKLTGDGSLVEITVPYHARRSISKDSTMESNRVDIGVFVHNGKYFSPPSFITFFFLDNEDRTYDASGRILDIGYNAGSASLKVSNWNRLFDKFKSIKSFPPSPILEWLFSEEERQAIVAAGAEYRKADSNVRIAHDRREAANAAKKAAKKILKISRKRLETHDPTGKGIHKDRLDAELIRKNTKVKEAEELIKRASAYFNAAHKNWLQAKKDRAVVLDTVRSELKASVRKAVNDKIATLLHDHNFTLNFTDSIRQLYSEASAANKKAFNKERNRLISYGVLSREPEKFITVTSILKGKARSLQPVTRYEKKMLQRLNATTLSSLLFSGIVTDTSTHNYVDNRITTHKPWRDVYHYGKNGNRIGWTRHQGHKTTQFNFDGLIVLKTDSQGRSTEAQTVIYKKITLKQNKKIVIFEPGQKKVYYTYSGPDDHKGQIKIVTKGGWGQTLIID